MKKFLLVAFVLVVSTLGFGQTTYDIVVGSGSTITGPVAGKATLAVVSAPIIAVYINGVLDPSFVSGQVSFKTGTKINGTPQLGDTFGAGGTFSASTNDLGSIFSGTFSSATWSPATLANGHHFYNLTGAVVSGANTGAFALVTEIDPSLTCFFGGSENIANININLTVN